MWKKLKSKKAETLVETLVSVLIAALSVTLLSTSVAVAAQINKTTREADEEFHANLAKAELCEESVGNINITFSFEPETRIKADIFGEGEFISYIKGETP